MESVSAPKTSSASFVGEESSGAIPATFRRSTYGEECPPSSVNLAERRKSIVISADLPDQLERALAEVDHVAVGHK
jgi:hypothetical protein